MPAGRSGAAPRRAKVKTAATAAVGAWSGVSPGRGTPRSESSSRRRRREGAGRRVHRPAWTPGGLIPVCPVRGGDRAGAGAPCAPREHPDYIYQRVVSPEAPTAPSSITQSGQGGPFRQSKSDIPPPLCPCPGSGPLPPDLPGRSNPRTPARSAPIGPPRGRSGPGCAPGNHWGALAVRRAPHPAITVRIHPGQRGAAVSQAAGHDARATRERRTCRSGRPSLLCRTRPTSRSPARLRRLLEPPPREAPHPAGCLAPALPSPSPPV